MKYERSNTTPYINLSIEENSFEIKGNAYSNTSNDIFFLIVNWVDHNIPRLEKELECIFALNMINSINQKSLLYMFHKLDHFLKQGKKIKAIWYYDHNDEDIFEFGEDIKHLYSIPIELKMKTIKL